MQKCFKNKQIIKNGWVMIGGTGNFPAQSSTKETISLLEMFKDVCFIYVFVLSRMKIFWNIVRAYRNWTKFSESENIIYLKKFIH